MHITDQMGIRISSLLLFFKILVIVQNCSGAIYSLTQSQPLLVEQRLISPGEVFELGFFVLGNSSKRYVGIRHKIISSNRIVWVANRENALSANDSDCRLIIGRDGNLKITDGQQKILWSTNVTVPSNSTVASLDDKGELILKDNISGLVLWESFNSPGDTFLPNMMLGYNFRTGEKRFLTSWKTDTDPAPGDFVVGLSQESPPQAFTWNGTKPYWRGGPWDKSKFLGIQYQDVGYQNGMFLARDNYQGTIYLTYNLFNNSSISMSTIEPSGFLKIWNWDQQLNRWRVTWQGPENQCGVYGTCGPFGVCSLRTSPICQCLKGFVPKSDEEWGKGNWTSGCVRRTQLTCRSNSSNDSSSDRSQNDRFLKISEIKLPDIYEYVYDIPDAQGCQQWCLRNCSCAAYAYPSRIGCMVWVKDLMDIQKFSSAGEDLYLRLDKSELGVKKGPIKLIISLVTVMCVILLGITLYYCLRKRKATKKATTGQRKNIHQTNQKKSSLKRKKIQDLLLVENYGLPKDNSKNDIVESFDSPRTSAELPLIDFTTIKKATNNFSEANKLGSGGFGTVYEGTLEDGRQVAVKRLSSHSGQGIEEFKNEVLLISKLQHRNLVRLLGCCIQGEEKLLILEFMKNNSLDSFVFDSTKRLRLDWGTRFSIIEGIARGLLYLHRDSCLRIIHRDLKASNILLDDNMNPKISDFGLARTFRITQELGNTSRVVGTFGYMSPEYAMGGLFSEKSDVYSYGVLLLEIISGKKNSGFPSHEKYFNLLGYAWQMWNEGKGLDLMDTSFADSALCYASEVTRCIQIGLLCVQDLASDRPTISNVVLMLRSEIDLPQPKQPTFTFQRMLNNNFQPCSHNNNSFSINEVTASVMEGR